MKLFLRRPTTPAADLPDTERAHPGADRDGNDGEEIYEDVPPSANLCHSTQFEADQTCIKENL